jgi:hypothetical protein
MIYNNSRNNNSKNLEEINKPNHDESSTFFSKKIFTFHYHIQNIELKWEIKECSEKRYYDDVLLDIQKLKKLDQKIIDLKKKIGDKKFLDLRNLVCVYSDLIFTLKKYFFYFPNKTIETNNTQKIQSIFYRNFFTKRVPQYFVYYKSSDCEIKKNGSFAFFCKRPCSLETILTWYVKNFGKIPQKKQVNFYELIYYMDEKESNRETYRFLDEIKNINKMYDFEHHEIKNPLTSQFIKNHFNDLKVNFVYLDTFIFHKNLHFLYRENVNSSLFVSLILIMMRILQPGGFVHIETPTPKTKFTANLLLILKHVFEDIFFVFSNEKLPASFNAFATIICKNYKGPNETIMNKLYHVLDLLYQFDPTGGFQYNVTHEGNRKELKIEKPLDDKSQKKFICSLLKCDDSCYYVIRKYHEKILSLYQKSIGKMKYAYNKFGDDLDAARAYYNDFKLLYNINVSQYTGLKLKPYFNKTLFSDTLGKKLLQEIFVLDEGIKFQFSEIGKKLTPIEISSGEQNECFHDLAVKMLEAKLAIDTRDIRKYNRVKQMMKLYQKSLGTYLKEKYNIQIGGKILSRAWTKMYEILYYFPDFLPKKKIVKSFSSCEAPGGFVLAMDYYLKTKRKGERLEWNAQSLNPKNPFNLKKYGEVIADTFGLIERYPDHWLWGVDDTGDITNIENIKFYKKHCENIDVFTSDCGIPQDKRENQMEKINFAQFVFMFYNVPQGANIIMKVFAPLYPQKISILYTVYTRFKKMFFYKPMQNPSSEEFYLIAYNYEKPLDEDEMKKLFSLLENYDPNKTITTHVPEEFNLQLERIMKKIADNFESSIEKKIYYVDNLENISQKHIKDLEETILRKNQEWAERTELEPNPITYIL